jgi:hypothetical protein
MDASKTVLSHGLVQLPVDADVVEDADEEVSALDALRVFTTNRCH